MSGPEIIQTVLGIVAVGGIGGVWFKLGMITATTDGLKRRVDNIERKMEHVSIIAHR